MQEPAAANLSSDVSIDELAEFLQQARAVTAEHLTSHRDRVDALEQSLTDQVSQITEQLERERGDLDQQREQIESLETSLARREENIERAKADLQQRSNEVKEQEAAARTQADENAKAREELDRREQTITDSEKEGNRLRAEYEELCSRQQAAGELQARIDDLSEELSARDTRIELLEEQLNAAADLQEELAQVRDDFESLNEEAATTARRNTELLEEVGKLRTHRDELTDRVEQLEDQLRVASSGAPQADSELTRKFELAMEEARELKRANADLEARLQARKAEGDSAALESLKAERDALAQKVTELEKRTVDSQSAADKERLTDLQHRFERAVAEVRELKDKNTEQAEQLARLKKDRGETPDLESMDWESQKRRLLASLEAESDDGAIDGEREEERLSIENTIRMTDEIISQKDQEILELKRLLDDQAKAQGDIALGAAAVADVLDADELIRDERRRLAELQSEWEEKLRQAEIDISVERAKIARERTELEERLREMEDAKGIQEPSGDGDKGERSHRRWFSRLGLGDSEE